MLLARAVDANSCQQHVIADVQPVDLDDQEIEIRKVAGQEGLQLLARHGHEAPRDRGLRGRIARACRQVAAGLAGQAHGARVLAGRNRKQHDVHRPGLQKRRVREQLPARQAHLLARKIAHPRARQLHLAPVIGNLALGCPPAMALPLGRAGVARSAEHLAILVQHLAQGLHPGQQAKAKSAIETIKEAA